MVDATCIYFSRPAEPVSGVFRRARRIFEKFDHPHEWTLDYLGHAIGYAPREVLLLPDSPALIKAGTALCWSPSVGPARSEDTVVVDERGYEVVTEAQNWPTLEVTVKGFLLNRAGHLGTLTPRSNTCRSPPRPLPARNDAGERCGFPRVWITHPHQAIFRIVKDRQDESVRGCQG